MTQYGDTPIDAKRFPAAMPIGVILMVIGFIIGAGGILSIVRAAVDEVDLFGIFGGVAIMFVGVIFLAIGGMLMFFGMFGKRRLGRRGRLLY
jgi:hypothetical protein